ncbi:DUF6551 family protein [Streptomyces sp. NPDC005953]|uniref:DUF6551 family protein n=1 Tax=Streptomyces sp. NPDC005953 TaxID=3156719 RepID=UPI00340B2879
MVATELPISRESVEWVPLAAIGTDRRVNTRSFDPAWVEKKLAEGFDPDGIGVPIVSHRGNGIYVWLDGQNRGELMRRAGWADQKIQCRVFYNLSLAQEAALFLRHNDSRRVLPIHKFLARVTSGEPNAVAITRIIESLGWRVSDQGGDRCIAAVSAVDKVYVSDRTEERPGGAVLELTLRVTTEAWGYKSEAVDGRILQGLGAVFSRFGIEAIDRPVLVKKLAAFPAGPSGVLGKARGMNQFQGGTVAHCVAEVVVTAYNARRRTNVLPDWR